MDAEALDRFMAMGMFDMTPAPQSLAIKVRHRVYRMKSLDRTSPQACEFRDTRLFGDKI